MAVIKKTSSAGGRGMTAADAARIAAQKKKQTTTIKPAANNPYFNKDVLNNKGVTINVPQKTPAASSGGGGGGGGSYTTTTSGSQEIYDAMNALLDRLNANQYKNPYSEQQQALIDKILNKPAFSYDFNEDPAYKAYEKKYGFYGEQARQDTLGDVAGMTGGIPSSYAVSAAAQAQNQWNSRLSDVIPELQNAAYNRYQNNIQNDFDASKLLADLDSTSYGRYDNDRNFAWNSGKDLISTMPVTKTTYKSGGTTTSGGSGGSSGGTSAKPDTSYYGGMYQEMMNSGDPYKWLTLNASGLTAEEIEWLQKRLAGTKTQESNSYLD